MSRPSLDPKKIRCHNGFILVKLFAVDTTRGGIIIPDTAKGDLKRLGGAVVVAVGQGRRTIEGKLVEPCVKVGDHVWLQSKTMSVTGFHPDMFTDADDHLLVRDDDIACVFEQ